MPRILIWIPQQSGHGQNLAYVRVCVRAVGWVVERQNTQNQL